MECNAQVHKKYSSPYSHTYFQEETAQSTLRRPEVRMFAWKIGIYMARMGVNDMRGVRATTNKIGSKFNTVTLDRSYFTVYLSDL